MKAYTGFGTRKTKQKEKIPGSTQVENSATGFAWAVDDWKRLDRFLILGAEGGTYYSSEKRLVVENAEAVARCIQSNGTRVVLTVMEISASGRAAKNDPALFVLAMAAGMGDDATRKMALSALPSVARIGTHLFNFLTYVQQFRGWGRGLRTAVSAWYTEKDLDNLAYQVVKYRQRNGWTHRDVLRKAHTSSQSHNDVLRWIARGVESKDLPSFIRGYILLQEAKSPKVAAKLIFEYGLPRETVPTQFLNDREVWEALFYKMPFTAMIRSLGKLSSVGILRPMSIETGRACARLQSGDALRKARVHPLSLLVALKTYEQGHGVRGSLNWEPVSQIVDAIDDAFYLAFDSVEPTNKRTMLALDVSGSMSGGEIAGMPGITPRVGSAAMALVTANVEPNYMTTIFSSSGTNFSALGKKRFSVIDGLSTISLSPKQRLDDVIRRISGLRFGGTDCALPMLYALAHKIEIDTFIIYTDNETWAGDTHPSQALVEYRQKTGINAKLVVVGMVSNEFSVADPLDSGMMDCVGFDAATPNIIASFAKE